MAEPVARIYYRHDHTSGILVRHKSADLIEDGFREEELFKESDLWALLGTTLAYLDPPDGGDVPLLVQLQRMAADAAKWREASKAVPVADERGAIEHALHLESEVNTEMPPHLQRGLAMHLHRQEQERKSRAEQLTAEDWDTCKQACERAREHIASANPSQPEPTK